MTSAVARCIVSSWRCSIFSCFSAFLIARRQISAIRKFAQTQPLQLFPVTFPARLCPGLVSIGILVIPMAATITYYSVMAAINRTIDDIDVKILNILQSNARESQVDIARVVGLAPSAVLERIRKLEARGAIKGYAAQVDPRVVGQGLLAFVAVRTEESPGDSNVAQRLAECAEVQEVHHVAGEDCYLIKVRSRDAEHLGLLLRTRLGRIPGVRSTRTTIVLETVKESPRFPIAAPEEALP